MSVAGLRAAPVELQFAGVDASEAPARVSLIDSKTKERDWVKIGGRFAGCEVRAYAPARRTLTLARDGETWEVPLQDGAIARATLSDDEKARISQLVLNNLRQLAAASDQYFMENGVSSVTIDKLVGPNTCIKWLKPADGEDYSKIDLTQPQPGKPAEWKIVTAQGVEVRYARD